MSKRRGLRGLVGVVVMVVLPVLALPAAEERAEKAAKSEKTAAVKKEAGKAAVPSQTKIERVQELLSLMRDDVEKFQYSGLFLGPEDKPVEGLVEFPAEKFAARLDEIEIIAKECRHQMDARQAEARAYYQKIGAPQLAAFEACGEGMEEVATLIHELRAGATKIRTSGGAKGARYILELNRLERSIAKIMALTSVCQRNMNRAEMVCIQFESKPPKEKPAKKVTW